MNLGSSSWICRSRDTGRCALLFDGLSAGAAVIDPWRLSVFSRSSRKLVRSSRCLGVSAVLILGGGLALASNASAATFTVNSATDAPLSTPSGTSCVSTAGGACTLRAAIQAADNTGGANTISVPGGDFKLTIAATAGGGADDPATGDLDVKTGSRSRSRVPARRARSSTRRTSIARSPCTVAQALRSRA